MTQLIFYILIEQVQKVNERMMKIIAVTLAILSVTLLIQANESVQNIKADSQSHSADDQKLRENRRRRSDSNISTEDFDPVIILLSDKFTSQDPLINWLKQRDYYRYDIVKSEKLVNPPTKPTVTISV